MNERIKELLVQSGLLDYTKIIVPEHEKFAELIVKECIGIIDEEGSHEGGSIRSMEAIKQHFGVEE